MPDKKEEPRVFKMWRCPFCAENFNHWANPKEEEENKITCPHCYSEVPIARKKMV